MTAELCGGMQVTVRLYFRGRRLGDVAQTRCIHGVPLQQGRGRGNVMRHTSYAA
jgi:hypothetical protein